MKKILILSIIVILFIPILIFGNIIKSKLIEGKTQEEAINIVALETEKNTAQIEENKAKEEEKINEILPKVEENTTKIVEVKKEVEEIKINIKEMNNSENKNNEEILNSSVAVPLTGAESKILELQQNKTINYKECQKRDSFISKLNSACEHKFETIFNTIKYKDIDFEQCLATANKKLLELNTKLSNLENIPENSVDIEMIKREIRDTIINIKDINYVKDNLLEIENKCFKKPL